MTATVLKELMLENKIEKFKTKSSDIHKIIEPIKIVLK
jgi:hypothetical protein